MSWNDTYRCLISGSIPAAALFPLSRVCYNLNCGSLSIFDIHIFVVQISLQSSEKMCVLSFTRAEISALLSRGLEIWSKTFPKKIATSHVKSVSRAVNFIRFRHKITHKTRRSLEKLSFIARCLLGCPLCVMLFFSIYFFSKIWIWREMMCVIASVREFVHEKVIKTLSTYDFRSFHNVFISILSVCSDSRKMLLKSKADKRRSLPSLSHDSERLFSYIELSVEIYGKTTE